MTQDYLPDVVRDKRGRPYEVSGYEGDSISRFSLMRLDAEVAEAICHRDSETEMNLSNIEVFDKIGKEVWGRRLKRFITREPSNYQRLGLGSALLDLVLSYARFHKVKLKGQIVRRDLNANPSLPDWYRRHGFTIMPPSQAVLVRRLDTVHEIEIDFRQP